MYINCGILGIIAVLTASYTNAAGKDPRKWMSSIPDKWLISNLDIPGTRDSCALYGGYMYETQSMSLREQLLAGIRYVDIGIRHVKNAFFIHRGIVYENLSFGSGVLQVIFKFLREYPRETVIMSVKVDKSGEDNTRAIEETLDWYISLYSRRRWYLKDEIPRLGKVRGKIVFVRRFELDMDQHGLLDKYGRVAATTSTRILGINLSKWIDGSLVTHKTAYGDTEIIVQDYFVSTLFYGPWKWKYISQWLDEAFKHQDKTWYINVAGASSIWAYPTSISKGSFVLTGMNERLKNFMTHHKNDKRRLGTIVMDFPESENGLISLIIQRNF